MGWRERKLEILAFGAQRAEKQRNQGCLPVLRGWTERLSRGNSCRIPSGGDSTLHYSSDTLVHEVRQLQAYETICCRPKACLHVRYGGIGAKRPYELQG